MGIAAAAADRAHRLDRDPAQDIAEQRRVAIDGAAGAAKACLFAQLPRSARDAYRVDRPGEAEVRFLLADEDRGAAIGGVAIDGRLGRPVHLVLLRRLGARTGEHSRGQTGGRGGPDRQTKQNLHAPSPAAVKATSGRSEEHTSELQSLMRNSYAVFS